MTFVTVVGAFAATVAGVAFPFFPSHAAMTLPPAPV